MKIGFYIGELLYQHDCVVIPGFGGFIANYTPAFIHTVQNTFNPPSRQLMFNARLDYNDGLLALHIAKEEGIDYDHALIRIAEEVVAYRTDLNLGKSIVLEGIGSFRYNHEQSIVFTPKLVNNLLEDAYGLSVFVSPTIRRNGYKSNRDTLDKRDGIRLPVAVRRIAAIAVPLIAIGLWSLFNPDRISRFTSNYSSVIPSEFISQFSFSSIEKSIPMYVLSHSKSTLSKREVQPEEVKAPITKVTTTVAIPKPESTTEKPIAKNTAAQAPSLEIKSKVSGHFLIIGGAFKVKENAEKLLNQLKAKNFDAALAGQNKRGLYLVSAATCDDADQAASKLKEVLGKGIEAAWILKN